MRSVQYEHRRAGECEANRSKLSQRLSKQIPRYDGSENWFDESHATHKIDIQEVETVSEKWEIRDLLSHAFAGQNVTREESRRDDSPKVSEQCRSAGNIVAPGALAKEHGDAGKIHRTCEPKMERDSFAKQDPCADRVSLDQRLNTSAESMQSRRNQGAREVRICGSSRAKTCKGPALRAKLGLNQVESEK